MNAQCLNKFGSYECVCDSGFSGNGKRCTGNYCLFFVRKFHNYSNDISPEFNSVIYSILKFALLHVVSGSIMGAGGSITRNSDPCIYFQC